MRALSIRAPWWWFILHAGKRVENRDWTWAPTWRGQLLIHSSSWWSTAEFLEAFDAGKEMAREEDWARVKAMQEKLTPRMFKDGGGKIVGRTTLSAAGRGLMNGDGWAVPGALHLVLLDVEAIDEPIPFKGALGFFDVPDELLHGRSWKPCT